MRSFIETPKQIWHELFPKLGRNCRKSNLYILASQLTGLAQQLIFQKITQLFYRKTCIVQVTSFWFSMSLISSYEFLLRKPFFILFMFYQNEASCLWHLERTDACAHIPTLVILIWLYFPWRSEKSFCNKWCTFCLSQYLSK